MGRQKFIHRQTDKKKKIITFLLEILTRFSSVFKVISVEKKTREARRKYTPLPSSLVL